MKRLVVTGLGCPARVWENWLGHRAETTVLPLFEVLEATRSNDLRELARTVGERILRLQPDSIVCHDLGVPLVLLSLFRLERKGTPACAKITLFNGTFRPLKLRQSTHTMRSQWLSYDTAARELKAYGGSIDERLKPLQPRLRALYRKLMWFSFFQTMRSLVGLEDLTRSSRKALSRCEMQIIASPNDPYIPYESIQQLKSDFAPKRFIEVPYGHFPYTVAPEKLLGLVDEFEKTA